MPARRRMVASVADTPVFNPPLFSAGDPHAVIVRMAEEFLAHLAERQSTGSWATTTTAGPAWPPARPAGGLAG